MNQKQLIRWGAFVGFLSLAGFSCWYTEQSIHLLSKNIPIPLVWVLTIAIFVLASIGTKMIVDACNRDNYDPHRRLHFWQGIIFVAIFWLVMSMPTNTHTFFYDHNIGNISQADIAKTSYYLNQISTRQNYDPAFDSIYNAVTHEFELASNEFNGYNRSSGRRGNGDFTKNQIRIINDILNHEGLAHQPNISFDDQHYNSTDVRILSNYEEQMRQGLDYIRDHKYKVTSEKAQAAKDVMNKLNAMADTISTMVQLGDVYTDIITQAEGILAGGYDQIKNEQKYIVFANNADKELYTAEKPETLTKRMLSVIDVWGDFLKGKYPKSFLYYVLLSIIVDLGAFIFFDIAFR